MTLFGDDYASAAILAELERAHRDPDPERRAASVWRLVNHAGPNADAGIVRDFALDQGTLASLDDLPRRGVGGRQAGTGWRNPCDGSQMVWIPPGPFRIGRPPPRRAKALPPVFQAPGFSLARHPVTNDQFHRFLKATGYIPPAWHPRNDRFLAHWQGAPEPPQAVKDHPVTHVSFHDAMHYCAWAGLTLPTEWLWERAARGTDFRIYPWGNQSPDEVSRPLINVRSTSTVPVGSFPWTRTPYGCEDLIGNVGEWCQLTPGDAPDQVPPAWPDLAPLEDSAPIRQASVRGSCFLRVATAHMTAWHRRRLSTARRNSWVGFRPASLLRYRPVLNE